MIPTKTQIIDMAWRTFWTATNAFIGGMLAGGTGIVDITALEAGKVAAIGAVLTLLKAYSSNALGTGTAGTGAAPAGLLQPVASNSATPA